MSRAWMPMYWGDYLADTLHLSTIQHGAYMLLIAHYWQHGGLPNDEQAIASITKLNLLEEWPQHREAIASMFMSDWRHKRIDDELGKAKKLKEVRAFWGSKGGKSKGKQKLRRKQKLEPSKSLNNHNHYKNLSSINSESETRSPEEPSTATATALFEGAPSPVSENPQESKKVVAEKKSSLEPSPWLIANVTRKLAIGG